MARATQIAGIDHRVVGPRALQATRPLRLPVLLGGRAPAPREAPSGPAVPAQASTTGAAGATVAMRLDGVGVVPLGMAVVERGDVTRVIAGPLRAELTADGVALADDRFVCRIIAAVRAA